MPARATSSGTISFGLVSIPIKLYSATQSKSVRFHMLDPRDKSRVKQQWLNASTGEPVERSELVRGYEFSRDQYVLFVGDGNDTCNETLALENVQALARAGVKTFVIAFDGSGGGVNPAQLNDLACGGRTASAFPSPCTDAGGGNYRATDPNGATLFLQAEDEHALAAALHEVAAQVCCGCIE